MSGPGGPTEGVRAASESDIAVLVHLYRLGAEEMTAIKAAWLELDGRPEPVEESFRSDLSNNDVNALIGTLDGTPVGFAVARLIDRLPQVGGRHARVSDLYVEPGAREIGVGEELVTALLAWARERGANSAEIRVLPGHRSAKNFCEENGFTARLLLMHRDLCS